MNKPVEPREHLDIEAILKSETSLAPGWMHHRLVRWALVATALLVLALFAATLGRSSDGVQYVTEPVTRGKLTVIVTATGSLQPTNKVEISSELSGTVRSVFVDYNSPVKAGETLAELDKVKLQASADNSRAKLRAAKAKVAEAEATQTEKERDLARKKALAQREFASLQDLDAAQAAYDRAKASLGSAEADVGVAEADLNLNETNLEKAIITSPISGIVLERNVDPGQTVASSLQAPVLFSIAEDLKQMELQVDVDEADVGKVATGQTAMFSVDAFPEQHFPAVIRDVRYASETIQGVVTYKAVLDIDNSQLLLRPGMTATAEVTVTEIENALLVPNASLRFTPAAASEQPTQSFLRKLLPGPPRFRPASPHETEGPSRTVWVLRDGAPVAIPVVVGSSDGKRTEVKSGELTASEAVITDQSSLAK